MTPLSTIKENPVVVLGLALLAFVAWIAYDSAKGQVRKPQPAETLELPYELPLPEPPTAVAIEEFRERRLREAPPGSTSVSSISLPLLRPGMKRVEVEFFLGPPTPDRILPVTLNDGRLTYSTAYELTDLEPPMTIRPIRPQPRVSSPNDGPRSMIGLVFDASEPGHPLLHILYPDPLF
jgi:hypothetical protein